MRALAITGPRSDRKTVQRFFNQFHPDVSLCDTPDPATLVSALKGCDVAVIFGGDGTLHRHLPALVDAQVPVLMVPTGSGNDFALASGIRTPSQAFSVFERTREGALTRNSADLGCAELAGGTSHLFACCLNVGLDADAARRTNLLPNWLKAAGGYFIGGMGAVFAYRPQHMEVTIGTETNQGEMWLACVSNTPTFGGGLPIAPTAQIDDGLLECTLVESTSRLRLMREYPKILRGKHVGLAIVKQRQTERIQIQGKHPMPVYGDGEHLGNLPATVSLRKKALHYLGD